jgi:hypothetical protein
MKHLLNRKKCLAQKAILFFLLIVSPIISVAQAKTNLTAFGFPLRQQNGTKLFRWEMGDLGQ